MGQKKKFPKIDLEIPKIEHTRDALGGVVIPLDVIPPVNTVVYFPAEGNASSNRTFDFAQWYGAGIDAITYACQRQIERFLNTHDGDRSGATVVNYCRSGLTQFLGYLIVRGRAECRSLTLPDINRDLIDGFLYFLNNCNWAPETQKGVYGSCKAVLVALGRRGLIRFVDNGTDDDTFPRNPFPNSSRKIKGEKPLPKAQRRAFTQAVKTAVMPLLAEGAEPTGALLVYAFLIVALHTGRNTTPLLEMDTDCLRAHPKDNVQFLVTYKRRGNSTSKVPLRDSKTIESTPSVLPTVVRLIRRVIELTAPLRAEVHEHLKLRLWLHRSRRHSNAGEVIALCPQKLQEACAKLVKDYGLTDVDGKPLKINTSRLRKTFANRIYEILDGDLGTTAIALGNTVQVAGANYMRPGEDAKKNWKFMGLALTEELQKATLGASEKTPAGRCTDIKQGEYAPKNGATCMNFLDCLRCRNYVVTGDDLYRLLSFYWLVVRERGRVEKRKWQREYAHIVRLIDRDVIETGIAKKVFNQRDVDVARDRARTNPHPYWATADILEVLTS